MADQRAKDIIAEFTRELFKQANVRNKWQRTAECIYPYAQITSEYTPGTERTQQILDTTPMQDMQDMVSGFKQVLIPAGQKFFNIKVDSKLSNNQRVQRYLGLLTEAAHEKIFGSNFMTQMDQYLTSGIVFGPMCMYVNRLPAGKFVYKASKIGTYVIFEDAYENVIGSSHKEKLTAAQAFREWGNDAGPSVIKAMEKPETKYQEFEFIYRVMPRENVNPQLSKQYNQNMAYEAVIVNCKDQHTVLSSGYDENPYMVSRWSRPEFEKDGCGIGTEMLPQIKILFKMNELLLECGNKWVDPPRQALSGSVEGDIRTGPRAINWVTELEAIRALDQNMNGSFPIGKDEVLMQREVISRAFYKNAFDPLGDLTGDRRTTLEIQERIRGTLKRLGPPVTRIWFEGMSPCLTRTIMLMIRNYDVPRPPEELAGRNFGIDYVGPLALALKSEESRGFQEFVGFVAQAQPAFPNVDLSDNIDFDDAIPRLARTFGVNEEDIATPEERQAKREVRAKEQQQRQAMEMAQAAGKAYKDGSGRAEEGSPADALMAGMGG